jgi:hypothetical protein
MTTTWNELKRQVEGVLQLEEISTKEIPSVISDGDDKVFQAHHLIVQSGIQMLTAPCRFQSSGDFTGDAMNKSSSSMISLNSPDEYRQTSSSASHKSSSCSSSCSSSSSSLSSGSSSNSLSKNENYSSVAFEDDDDTGTGNLLYFFDAQTPLSEHPWNAPGTEYMICYLLHHCIQAVSLAWKIYQSGISSSQNLQSDNRKKLCTQSTNPHCKQKNSFLSCLVESICNLDRVACNLSYLELRACMKSKGRMDQVINELNDACQIITSMINACDQDAPSSDARSSDEHNTCNHSKSNSQYHQGKISKPKANANEIIAIISSKMKSHLDDIIAFYEFSLCEWTNDKSSYDIWYCAYHRPRYTYEHKQAVVMKYRWEKRKPWVEYLNPPQTLSNVKQIFKCSDSSKNAAVFSPDGSMIAVSEMSSFNVIDSKTGTNITNQIKRFTLPLMLDSFLFI